MTTDQPTLAGTDSEVTNWLTEHCGRGLPYENAHDLDSALHGAAYTVRQIEGTNKYTVHIGQSGPASSGIRWLLEYVARNELARTHSEPRPVAGLREAFLTGFDVATKLLDDSIALGDPRWPEVRTFAADKFATISPDPTSLEGGEGWQDMSSAPKDGSHILAWFWSKLPSSDYGWADTIRWWNGMWWDDREGPCEPAVWMPRPAPPAAAHPSTQGV